MTTGRDDSGTSEADDGAGAAQGDAGSPSNNGIAVVAADIVEQHAIGVDKGGGDAGVGASASAADARAQSGSPDTASLLSWMTVAWLSPLVALSRTRPLYASDLPPCPRAMTTAALGALFAPAWRRELGRSRGRGPRLWRAMGAAVAPKVVKGACGLLVWMASQVALPFLIKALLEYLTVEGEWTDGEGAAFAVGLGLTAWVGAQSFLISYLHMQRAGMEARAVAMNAIFAKCTAVTAAEASAMSLGSSANLMSVDAEKLYLTAQYVHALWAFPIMCAVVLGILASVVGVGAVAGVALLCAMLPLQVRLTRLISNGRRSAMRHGDARVKWMSEILTHIRAVKVHAWEGAVEDRVTAMRNAELRHVRSALFTRGWLREIMFVTPQLVATVIVCVYVYGEDNRLSTIRLFEVLAFVNALRTPSMMFAQALSSVGEAWVALQRIERFLAAAPTPSALMVSSSVAAASAAGPGLRYGERRPDLRDDSDAPVVAMEGVSCTWDVGRAAAAASASAAATAPATASPTSNGVNRHAALLSAASRWQAVVSPTADTPLRSGSADTGGVTGPAPLPLADVTLSVRRGELVAVVGVVGSGKSTLLQAMLGEIPLLEGTSVVCGRVAYCAQTPWIQNLTLRDNVLFGAPLDRRRYAETLDAACLASDCALLPSGDLTEIGERGINLSGGQKARVAFARALYARPTTNVCLLDDPFSAVDGPTGHRMFDLGVAGLLDGTTRVVTLNSHLHLMPRFDRVVVVEGGRVAAQGKASELREVLARFVASQDGDDDGDGDGSDKHDDGSAAAAADAGAGNGNGGKVDTAASALSLPSPGGAPASVLVAGNGTHTTTITSSSSSTSPGAVDAPPTTTPEDEQCLVDRGQLVQAESRKVGAVSAAVYRQYFGAAVQHSSRCAGVALLLGVVLLFAAGQALRMTSDAWLVVWTEDGSEPSDTDGFVFIALLGAAVVMQMSRVTALMTVATASGRNMHRRLFKRVVRAPVPTFFDVTATGEIINRFSSDLERVDMLAPDGLMQVLQNSCHTLGIVVLCVAASPILVAVILPLAVYARTVLQRFRGTFRDLKRIESVSRTPVYATFGETLTGLSTVRAYSAVGRFRATMQAHVDANSSHFLLFRMASLWLMWRLDVVAAAFFLCLSLLLVATKSWVDGALAGLALVYAMQLTSLLQRVVFMVIETETHMTSAERIFHYLTVAQEPPDAVPDADRALGDAWPLRGAVEFRNATMSYRGNPPVLRNVSLCIPGGARVGVCGRTGAGKSSLFVALFRLNELDEGCVLLDGVDTATVGLRKLRRAIGVIPQDPTLLSGTLRFNIDPWREHSDDEVWAALDRVRLGDTVRRLGAGGGGGGGDSGGKGKRGSSDGGVVGVGGRTGGGADNANGSSDDGGRAGKAGAGLDVPVDEGGANFSQGERQLICIARALLRDDVRVLVCDEATASIDSETDALVQSALRDIAAKGVTTVTIAHRLQTIANADLVVVMDAGHVAECGPPAALLARPDGLYSALARAAGLDVTGASGGGGVGVGDKAAGDDNDDGSVANGRPAKMSLPSFLAPAGGPGTRSAPPPPLGKHSEV